MDFGSDLALERSDALGSGAPGVVRREREEGVTEIEITSEEGEKALGKPVGRYITVDVRSFASPTELLDGRLDALTREIRGLLPKSGCVLVAGLGNRALTADALGPVCSEKIFATRHIGKELTAALKLENLRPVASIETGVLGRTGVEALEIIRGVSSVVHPECVIVIDALAASDIKRLGTTVQLTDTGISPGSGVGNRRKEISERTLGVPVTAVGVPTVISARTLAVNVLKENTDASEICENDKYSEMTVASREADLITSRAAELISLAVNAALQPTLTHEDFIMLTR